MNRFFRLLIHWFPWDWIGKALFNVLSKTSEQGIALVNEGGFVTECNDFIIKTLGSQSDLFNRPINSFFPSIPYFNEPQVDRSVEKKRNREKAESNIELLGLQYKAIFIPLKKTGRKRQVYFLIMKLIGHKSASVNSIRLEEAKFKSVFNSVSELIVTIDKKNGTILDLNNRWCQILDGSPSQLIGKNICDIDFFENREVLMKALNLAVQTGFVENVELSIRSSSGERIIGLSNFNSINYGFRDEIILNIHDISEGKLVESLLSFIAKMAWSKQKDNAINQLIKFVADQIGSEHMVVSKIDSAHSKAHTLAFLKFGVMVQDISYDLDGTPCHDVFNGDICIFNENIQQRFPQDKGLVVMNAESYVGVPIVDSQQKHIGIVAAIHTQSFKNAKLISKLLQIAANYIGGEIERIHHIEIQQLQEANYRQLFDSLTAGVVLYEAIFDVEGNVIDFKFLDVNVAYQTMLGLTKAQLVGKGILQLWPDANQYWIDFFISVIIDRQTKHFEGFSNLFGKYYSGYAYSPIPNQLLLIFQDITETRITEQVLKERELHLNVIFENTPSALILVNEHAEIVQMNPAGYRLADLSELGPIEGLQFGNIMRCINSFEHYGGCGKSSACKLCHMRKLIRNTFAEIGIDEPQEVLFRQAGFPNAKDNYFVVSSGLVSIKGAKHVLITLENITNQKLLELDLVESRNKAMESDRLKSAFFNNLSHEIRTPLNGIVGFSNLLRREEISKEETSLYVQLINENSNRLLNCMNNVVELSNIVSCNYTPSNGVVELTLLMERCLKYCKAITPQRSHLVRWEIKGGSGFTGDSYSIQSIVNQLLANALKFTVSGEIRIRWYVSHTMVSCLVSDTGIGIDEKDYLSILHPFKQVEDGLNRSFGGVGIGLAIVKGYLDLLGGTICIRSEKERGSVFRFSIPLK